MCQSIEQMLSQLREHLECLDRLIDTEVQQTPRWLKLCHAWDAVDLAIAELENLT